MTLHAELLALGQRAGALLRARRESVAVAEGAAGGLVSAALLSVPVNRVQHGIRCYDPCLSCSTHAVGQMPMQVQLIGPEGEVLDEVTRS